MVFDDVHKLKVFYAVIVSNMVDMMNYFVVRKITSYMVFQYKRVKWNISMLCCLWMSGWRNRINIPVVVCLPAIPDAVWPSRNCGQRRTYFRAIVSIAPVNVAALGIKRVSTPFAMAVGFLKSILGIIRLALSGTINIALSSYQAFWRNIKPYSADRAEPISNFRLRSHNKLLLTSFAKTLYHGTEVA